MNQDEPVTKLNAISLITMATKRGRRYVEAKLKAMEEAGEITVSRPSYTSAILISRADVEKVIAAIQAEPPRVR